MIKKIISSTVVIGILFVFGPFSQVNAQETKQIDLSISPPVNYIRIEPGKTFRLAITVNQAGVLPLKVTPSLVDFKTHPQSGQPQPEMSTTFKYVTVENEPKSFDQPFSLKPGVEDQVVLFFNVPETARPQEYHLSLLLTAQPEGVLGQDQTQTNVSAVIASNIIVLVAHSDENQGELEIQKLVLPRFVDSLSKIQFDIQAFNKGPTATKPKGKAVIRDFFGEIVASFPYYPDVVLAQSNRPLRAASQDPETVITPDELAPLPFVYDPAFLLGPYKVEVVLESEAGQPEVATQSQMVIALPFSIVLSILGVIGLLFLVRVSGKILIAKSRDTT